MQITLKLDGKSRKLKTSEKIIEGLLKENGVCTESVLVKRNKKFVPAEYKMKGGDVIELIEIISRG